MANLLAEHAILTSSQNTINLWSSSTATPRKALKVRLMNLLVLKLIYSPWPITIDKYN